MWAEGGAIVSLGRVARFVARFTLVARANLEPRVTCHGPLLAASTKIELFEMTEYIVPRTHSLLVSTC